MNSLAQHLANREQRIADGKMKRRINGCKQLLYITAAVDALPDNQSVSGSEDMYLQYLCGLREHEPDALNLSPHQKARIGNLFLKACRLRKTYLDDIPSDAIPGRAIVARNRQESRELHKANGKRKRAKS